MRVRVGLGPTRKHNARLFFQDFGRLRVKPIRRQKMVRSRCILKTGCSGRANIWQELYALTLTSSVAGTLYVTGLAVAHTVPARSPNGIYAHVAERAAGRSQTQNRDVFSILCWLFLVERL